MRDQENTNQELAYLLESVQANTQEVTCTKIIVIILFLILLLVFFVLEHLRGGQLSREGRVFSRIDCGSFDGLAVDKVIVLAAVAQDAAKNDEPHELAKALGQELRQSGGIFNGPG